MILTTSTISAKSASAPSHAPVYIQRRLAGGIQPAGNKALSAKQPVRRLPLPKKVVLPLVNAQGIELTPLVAVGDAVQTGQLLAQDEQGFAASLHASISGILTAIKPMPLAHSSGLSVPSLCIEAIDTEAQLSKPQLLESQPSSDWHNLSRAELLAKIQQAGLVGLGGAAFPSAVKISGASAAQPIKLLIANAAECEPYISADDALLQNHAYEVLEGLALVQHLVQAEQVLIGIEDNKPEAIQALQTALAQHPLGSCKQASVQICVVPSVYPSGGEKQLIQLLSGQEVPSGQIPLSLGILCHNVATLFALQQAVIQGQPFIERLITVTGQEVGQPGNYWVRLGTPLNEILAATQTNPAAERLIIGGPMMGFSLDSFNYHLDKNINCLLVPSQQELPLPGPEMPCIRCGKCELACPVQLLPQQLYFYSAHQNYPQAQAQNLFDCIECGACAWVCPSEIPLVQYFRHAKTELKHLAASAQKADLAKQRFEARNLRLAAEKAEREAKRQARAAAAAKIAAAKKAAASSQNPAPAELKKQAANSPETKPQADKKPAVTEFQPNPTQQAQAQLKQLNIAKAAAKVAVNRAQKTLHNLQTSPDATPEQLSNQQELVAKAEQQLAQAEQRAAAAQEALAASY